MSHSSSPSASNQSTGQVGVFMALAAFGWWAWVTPLYFHVLDSIPASEQLAWRVISGLPAMLLILLLSRQWSQLITILRSPRVLLLLVCSASLLSINWFTFTWAVINQRLVEGRNRHTFVIVVKVKFPRLKRILPNCGQPLLTVSLRQRWHLSQTFGIPPATRPTLVHCIRRVNLW